MMSQVGREIIKTIHQGKWVAISYKVADGSDVTKSLIAVNGINTYNKTLNCLSTNYKKMT